VWFNHQGRRDHSWMVTDEMKLALLQQCSPTRRESIAENPGIGRWRSRDRDRNRIDAAAEV